MEKLFLSFLLLASTCLYAGECSKPTSLESTDDNESPIAYMEEFNESTLDYDEYNNPETSLRMEEVEQYNNELNHFLSESEDIKIQLSAFNSFFGNEFKNSEIKKVLKTAIDSSSDRYTIYLADSLCHNNAKITNWCHQQNIHEIHREIDPENIFTYLFSLHERESQDNTQEILIEAADISTYSNSFFFEYILEKAQQIEYFNDENPILFNEYSTMANSSDDIIDYIKEMQDTISVKQLVAKGIVSNDYIQHINENTSFIAVIGTEMATTMPFRELMQACKTLNTTDTCLQIGTLLMTDKALMNQMIGSAIITEAQKQLSIDEEAIKESKEQFNKITDQHMCYALIEDVMYAMMFNKNMMTQYIVDAKKHGEVKALRNLAYSVYNTEKQNGFNPTFDPKDCH